MNKESLLRLVEKVGIWDAAKMVGLSITEILTITKYPLYPTESYEVLLDLISHQEIPTSYKEFIISADSYEGTVSWTPLTSIRTEYNGRQFTEGIMILATPYWDGRAILPYNVEYYVLNINGLHAANEEQPDFYLSREIPSKFRDIEDLLQWYEDVYLPGVYDNIINTILPQLRAEYI
jgi:hypothetical protein